MPDASGAFKGISVPADAWERVFGKLKRVAGYKGKPCLKCGRVFVSSIEQDMCGPFGCDDR